MTSNIEKQFFDTFGIEPRIITEPRYSLNSEYYEVTVKNYSQITDSILLELILINTQHEDFFGYPTNIQELKDNTLNQLIETYNKFSTCVTCDGEYQQSARNIKHRVQALFKENN